MVIAIDYDQTISRDVFMWSEAIELFLDHGHDVYVVTQNYEYNRPDIVEFIERRYLPVVFCGMGNKSDVLMEEHGVVPDIWIDDDPKSIVG